MEFLLQQEGSLGIILLLVFLLVGLLYLLMPFFIWRIWFWSHQNSKHLQELNTKLELLIRDIAPDALPPIEVPVEPKTEETTEETSEEEVVAAAAASVEGDEDIFSEDEFDKELSEGDDMDFSMSDEFEDVSDDLADSEISDFTDEESNESFAGDFSDIDRDESNGEETTTEEDEDELVMDFDEDEDESELKEEKDDIFSDAEDEPEEDSEESAFSFEKEEISAPTEIPVTDTDSSDFTVEHFESNEEKSFEFEDVDDSSFGEPADSFSEEDLAGNEAPAEKVETGTGWDESSTDDIWGEEASKSAGAAESPAEEDEDFSFGNDSDLGSAFDEPAAEKEGVGDVANSFLSDLEDKLNLDSFSEKSATTPEPPTAPQPDPPKAPEPEPKKEPAESQATLFARCEGCGHKLAYKQSLSGKRVRCPACRTAFALP